MTIDLSSIGAWIAQVTAAFGGSFLAFIGATSSKFGERFLGHHFDRKLADLKHDQNAQIEALRAELAHLSDRGRRSNEREFDAISAVWEKFVDAYLATTNCAIDFHQHPDLVRLSTDNLLDFLDETPLTDAQKKTIIEATDKNDRYRSFVTLRSINAAHKAIFDVRQLLRKNGIFVPDDLARAFQSAIEVLTKAEVQRYMEFSYKGPRDLTDVSFLLINGDKIFNELNVAVRNRLCARIPASNPS